MTKLIPIAFYLTRMGELWLLILDQRTQNHLLRYVAKNFIKPQIDYNRRDYTLDINLKSIAKMTLQEFKMYLYLIDFY